MAREKRFVIRLTRPELESLQRVLEQVASGATAQQLAELESLDGQIYRALYPDLVLGKPPRLKAAQDTRTHPMPLRSVLKLVRD